MSSIVQATSVAPITVPQLPKADSCILVIFGATGDLTRRKLIPALYDLACVGCMSPHFDIVGMGRKQLSDEEFRVSLEEAAAHSKDDRNFSAAGGREFAQH